MSRRGNRIIFGSVMGLAAIAVAIDHTKHTLPEPTPAAKQVSPEQSGTRGQAPEIAAESPCGLDGSPCGLGESPCGLGESPCSLE